MTESASPQSASSQVDFEESASSQVDFEESASSQVDFEESASSQVDFEQSPSEQSPSEQSPPQVDFYFDVVCPYAYLAFTQVAPLCARLGVALRYRPILLGGLFRVVGAGEGPMPSMPLAKAKLNLRDIYRWAEHLDVKLTMPASHPNRTVLAMRCIIASDDVPAAAGALYASYWDRGENVSDAQVVERALNGAGFDGAALLANTAQPVIKQRLRDAVDEAAGQGAFGVPSFVVHTASGKELYWGQDRLAFVERVLTRTA